MQLFVVVILITLAAVVQSGINKTQGMTDFATLTKACMIETGGTDADLAILMRHDPAERMEGKCLQACILKGLNVMDANGKFVKEVAMRLAEHHTQGDPIKMKIADEVTDICKDIPVSDNSCEAAEQYALCGKEEAAKRGGDILDL